MTIGILLLAGGCARVQVLPATEKEMAMARSAPALTEIPLGEKLTYQISWWGIPVGIATLTTTPAQKADPVFEKGVVKLKFEARSNAYLKTFYSVRVELISFMDEKTRSPRRFEAMVRRHWRSHQSVITFDSLKQVAIHQLPKGKSAAVPIQAATQDGLSLLYYARMLPLEVGQKIPLEVTADGRNWSLTGRVLQTSWLDLKNVGSWPAIKGGVELTYPVPFFQGARAWVWFSADHERIPLLAKIRSRIGPVTVVLVSRSTTRPTN